MTHPVSTTQESFERMRVNEEVGSKYRFIILAGQRVAQLQKGAKHRVRNMEEEKLTMVATAELSKALLKFHKISERDKVGDAGLDSFVPPTDPDLSEA